MCAIAGVVGLNLDEKTLDQMLESMKYRGPDENGIYRHRDAVLLHSRLTVIDPAGGKQPMDLHWQNEHFILVYNGEIYNTKELREELILHGHQLKGHSDTEVLLHAYVEWGQCCLEKLNGIYAFAVWEEKAERLFLARDRMGVKPLFYRLESSGVIFASELKTILCHPEVYPELEPAGAAEILLLGPGRTPGCGVLRGMKEIEPGCFGIWENKKITTHRYWMLKDREHRDTFEETAQMVRYLVCDAIEKQLVSDVPVGTFLSGGLDSSLITAVCAEHFYQKGSQLPTFSVDYVDQEKYFVPNKFQPNSDGYYIHKMQQAYHTDHTWCILSVEELMDELENATRARDLPGMADVDFSLLAFCRKIKQRVTVALSGECADEIFGGYPWYRDPEIRSAEGFPWAQNTAYRIGLMTKRLKGKLNPEEFVWERYHQTCVESDILPGTSPEETRMKQMMNLNVRWFMQTLLDRKDRMSMFSGLEVRVPFCDYRIAEYLYGVPWAFKDYQGREKGLLRYAMRGILPEEVLFRKKSPYPKTYDPNYLKIVSAKLEEILQQKNAPIFELFDKKAVRAVLTEEPQWPWYGQLMRRPQLIAYLLQTNFWLETYGINIL